MANIGSMGRGFKNFSPLTGKNIVLHKSTCANTSTPANYQTPCSTINGHLGSDPGGHRFWRQNMAFNKTPIFDLEEVIFDNPQGKRFSRSVRIDWLP